MDNVVTHEDWKACFSELAPGLLLFARQWVRSAADAEDIVQDAFVRCWRSNHTLASRGVFFAAVRTAALDLLRRDARRARREAEALGGSESSFTPAFEPDESRFELTQAIERLPHEQREVLVMKIWNDLTFAEIAEALSISQNTAASRYRYALSGLKKILQPYE